MQLCFVLFGHNYLVTNQKPVVKVLINKLESKTKQNKTNKMTVYHVSLPVPCKTFKAKFKRKELPPFLIMIVVYARKRLVQ